MAAPTILLADDNRNFAQAVQIRLESLGYRVLTASDGHDAVELAQAEAPDLLLFDVNMPAGDGFAVKQKLDQELGPTTPPVIYITGDHSPRLDGLADQAGAFALFHKPFDLSALMDAIERAVAQPV